MRAKARWLRGYPICCREPIFFERNRVFRVYQGGSFHQFFGDPPEDGSYPEEWVASTVRALNKQSGGEYEGISRFGAAACPSPN